MKSNYSCFPLNVFTFQILLIGSNSCDNRTGGFLESFMMPSDLHRMFVCNVNLFWRGDDILESGSRHSMVRRVCHCMCCSMDNQNHIRSAKESLGNRGEGFVDGDFSMAWLFVRIKSHHDERSPVLAYSDGLIWRSVSLLRAHQSTFHGTMTS